MGRDRGDEAQLITSAPESNDDEYDRRRKKYAIMMSLRIVCVILAALTYRVSPYLMATFIVGGIVLPWCAVIIANDGPAKKRAPAPSYRPGMGGERALTSGEDRTIDG
ncbi:MAG: DUF3099 domain-containing protein [Jatrophihabitans sp.]